MRTAASIVVILLVPLLLPVAAPLGLAAKPIEPRLAEILAHAPAQSSLPVIARYADDAGAKAALASLGARPSMALPTVHAFSVAVSPAEALALASAPGVRYVQADGVERALLTTATRATRAQAVWGTQDAGPVMLNGTVIDGAGVGVAVVDTGIDALHPDLEARTAANYKVINPVLVDPKPFALILGNFTDSVARSLHLNPGAEKTANDTNEPGAIFASVQDSDADGGHGTHVAGIVAGDGTASGGKVRGAAPGASLYGFSVGDGDSIITSEAAAAFDWVVQHHAQVNPPIRVVTNSWGPVSSSAYDPNNIINQLANRLVAEGIVVCFAAGNGDALGNGGDGTKDVTNAYSKNPTPGVLGVANYDDRDSGTRDGSIAPSSSRGLASNPSTWPDVAAPGTNIYAAFNPTGPISWSGKSIDLAFAWTLPGSNAFGNAINQWQGNVSFVFGGAAGPQRTMDFIIFSQSLAIYNAHRHVFANSALPWANIDTTEAQQARLFWPAPATSGPFVPASSALVHVAPGDIINLTRGSGTADSVQFTLVAPSGVAKTTYVTFPCGDGGGCSGSIDLDALFHGEPADGTWVIGPATGSTDPSRVSEALNPYYVQLTGTSMATPHIAGIVALMLEANPNLTPAQVERIMENTAYQFAGPSYAPDPSNSGSLSSFDAGHGLADARAAVDAAIALR